MIEPIEELFFGPYVARYNVNDELINGLLERGEKLTPGDANKDLAGYLKDQRHFTIEDKKWFIEKFQPYADSYSDGYIQAHNFRKEFATSKFQLIDLWINYMKQNEYNPPHTHDGQVSWVIFLNTIDLNEEIENYKGTAGRPGSFVCEYGENQLPYWAKTGNAYLPTKGEMFMFPAMLRHFVVPFKSNQERISVSGNFFFSNPNEPSGIAARQPGQ